MFILFYIIGCIFAFVEMVKADMAYMHKWGKGYDSLVLMDVEFYLIFSLFSWCACIPALLLRKKLEKKYGKHQEKV